MPRINLETLESALAALEEGLQDYQHTPIFIARDGVIQRFEVVIDLGC